MKHETRKLRLRLLHSFYTGKNNFYSIYSYVVAYGRGAVITGAGGRGGECLCKGFHLPGDWGLGSVRVS